MDQIFVAVEAITERPGKDPIVTHEKKLLSPLTMEFLRRSTMELTAPDANAERFRQYLLDEVLTLIDRAKATAEYGKSASEWTSADDEVVSPQPVDL